MKKFFTLCVLVCSVIISRSQAVLNELYPQPGNGYHEFFELYNESDTTENLDNYTVVIYYEEGVTSGFYILDLPNYSLSANGYYVGASQNPFDIQSQLGQPANFSWNSMPAGGALTKWERNGSTYTSVPVPANLNDLIVRVNGGGGSGVFHVFVYKNGILVNGIIGGISTSVIPAYIKTMPNLPVNMTGSSPDFTINFGTMPDNSLEYLPNAVGTNNGYFRSADGFCGEWLKSDSPGQHTPLQTNGTSANLTSQISIAASISQYIGDPNKALLTYNLSAGPASAFPVIVEVYIDNGIAGQLDINDVLFDTRTINDASAGAQNIILPNWDINVIIVLRPASNCYKRTIPVTNFWSVLPVHLINFQGNINNSNKVSLQWKVGDNETINQFEVERSYDGIEFKTIALVFASEKNGIEDYIFYETINNFDKVMYRLKMIDKRNEVSYSRILVFQNKLTTNNNNIKIIGNPVKDKLTFNYTAYTTQIVDVKIYDMSGRIMMSNKISSLEGNNIISFPLASTLKANMYLVEVNNGAEIQTAKFIKN